MSKPSPTSGHDPHEDESGEPSKGPNLILLYTLLALALLGAMAVAAAIVWPFYTHR
jgi:hypothetical protein